MGPHDLPDLARFKTLMAEDGHPVFMARRLLDRRYALNDDSTTPH